MTSSEQFTGPSSSQGLRRRAEEITREKERMSPGDLDDMSPEETRQMFHEFSVHQVELEMQNEELRMAKADLDASLERYFELYDLAPVGYITVSQKGLLLEANLTAVNILNVTRSKLGMC